MPFNIPRWIFVASGDRWWRLHPDRLRHAWRWVLRGTAITAQHWTDLGRLVPGPPRGILDDPGKLYSGTKALRILHPAQWTRAQWQQMLEELDLREEWFSFLGFQFDVSAAKRIAQKLDLPVKRAVPTEAWWDDARGLVRVNPARLAQVNMAKPTIFITLADDKGVFRQLIDGNHRASRGLEENTEVPYVVLPPRATLRLLPKNAPFRAVRRSLATTVRAQEAGKSASSRVD